MRGHALAAADVPVCASCEEPITHHPVIRGGEEFCCAGCGAGGPCICTGRVAPPDFDWQDEPPVSRRLAEQDAPPLYGERATFRPAQYDDLRALPLSGPAVLRVAGLRSQAELLDLANALEADPRIDALSLIRARLDDCWFSVTVPTVRELEEALLHLDRFEVRTRTHPAGIDVTVRAVDPAAAAAEAGTDVVARRPRLWQVPRSDELPTIEAAPTALAPEGSPADAPEYSTAEEYSAPEYSAPEYSTAEEYSTPEYSTAEEYSTPEYGAAEYSTPEYGTAEDGADERASAAPPVPPARSEPRGVLPPPLPVPGRRAESAPVSPAPPAPAPPITAREWDAEADRAPQAPAARTTPSAAPSAAPSPASSAAGAASEWDDAAAVPPAQPTPAPAELAPAGPAQAVPPAATTSEPAASEHAVPEHAVPEHAVPERAVPERAVSEHAVPERAVPERAVSEPTVVAYTAAEPAVAEPPAAAPATVAAGEGGIIAADARPGGAAPLREHLTLVAYPFNSFATLNEFQEAVRRLHGVTNVKVRRFYRGTLHLAVEYEDILPFAHRLRELDAFRWDMVAERDAEMEIMLVDDGAITVDSAASGRGPGDGASAHAPSGPATNRRDSGERVG